MSNKKDKNTIIKDTRKQLPQSSIIGKRKEVFDLSPTRSKNKKDSNN